MDSRVLLTLHSPLKFFLILHSSSALFLFQAQLNSHFHFSLQASLLPLQRLKTTTGNPVKLYCACFSPSEQTNLQKTDCCARNCREEFPFITLTLTHRVHNVTGATGWWLRSQANSGISYHAQRKALFRKNRFLEVYIMPNHTAAKLCRFKTAQFTALQVSHYSKTTSLNQHAATATQTIRV